VWGAFVLVAVEDFAFLTAPDLDEEGHLCDGESRSSALLLSGAGPQVLSFLYPSAAARHFAAVFTGEVLPWAGAVQPFSLLGCQLIRLLR
jgi:hypothetical protein